MQEALHLLKKKKSFIVELCQVEWGTSLHPHLRRGCKSADADADAGWVALPSDRNYEGYRLPTHTGGGQH